MNSSADKSFDASSEGSSRETQAFPISDEIELTGPVFQASPSLVNSLQITTVAPIATERIFFEETTSYYPPVGVFAPHLVTPLPFPPPPLGSPPVISTSSVTTVSSSSSTSSLGGYRAIPHSSIGPPPFVPTAVTVEITETTSQLQPIVVKEKPDVDRNPRLVRESVVSQTMGEGKVVSEKTDQRVRPERVINTTLMSSKRLAYSEREIGSKVVGRQKLKQEFFDKIVEVPTESKVERLVVIEKERIIKAPIERLVEREVEQLILKELRIPVEVCRERVKKEEIRVNTITTVEKQLYVDCEIRKERIVPNYVENIREIPVEVIVIEEVEVPVEVFVEKIVEIPVPIQVERIIKVPVANHVEKIVSIPVERVIEKLVEVPIERLVERRVEVPYDNITERFVEVPHFTQTYHSISPNRYISPYRSHALPP